MEVDNERDPGGHVFYGATHRQGRELVATFSDRSTVKGRSRRELAWRVADLRAEMADRYPNSYEVDFVRGRYVMVKEFAIGWAVGLWRPSADPADDADVLDAVTAVAVEHGKTLAALADA